MKSFHLLAFAWIVGWLPQTVGAEPPLRDVVFAKVDGHELRLDFYMPQETQNPPLVVFIHGGGWRANSYKRCLTPWLAEYGFAVASVGYRLSGQATFPAQIHDCKAAVRWLRAHAQEYGYDAERIGVAGTSAGGHLALMMGVTGGEEQLEGNVGGNLEQSSRVQAVVDYYGPSDFVLRSQNQPSKTDEADSPVRLLLGVPVRENLELARLASPAYHVNEGDPPLLILHGDQDQKVHLDQAQRMADVYQQAKLPVTLEVVAGAGHGGAEIFSPAYRKQVAKFLRAHLTPAPPSGK